MQRPRCALALLGVLALLPLALADSREQVLKSMLDRLEAKYARTQGVATSQVPSLLSGLSADDPLELENSPLSAIKGAFKSNDSPDPEVANDAYSDDADWFDKAAEEENVGMTPNLDYPQGVKEPDTFTPQQMSDSIASIDADIRHREGSWDRLVNDGGREWAKNQDYAIRAESDSKIRAAMTKAAAAEHDAVMVRAASSAQGMLMKNAVKQVVYDAKWSEQEAKARALAAEKQAAMLRVINAEAAVHDHALQQKYHAYKHMTVSKIHELHEELRALRASKTKAEDEAARQTERAKLAKAEAAEGSSKADKMQEAMDSLLSRLGDARAGLAWLSAKLGAAKDDTSEQAKTSDWWKNKAEAAGKRARKAEDDMQDAESKARREHRKAQRAAAFEKTAEHREGQERAVERAALAARREAEVWATKEEGQAATEKLRAESEALHADKDRKRLAKAMTSLQHEREKELEDERAESSAVGKAELAEQDEEKLRSYSGTLEVLAGQRAAQANASLALERRAEAAAEDAHARSVVASNRQQAAEKAEELAIQRMHALEASGMQDSHELLRLRQELREAHNKTEEWRIESMHQQSLFEQAEKERLEAQARAETSTSAAEAASEARATAEAKLEESEANKEEAIEEKSKAVDAASEAARKEAAAEEKSATMKTMVEEDEEKLQAASVKAGELQTRTDQAQKLSEEAEAKSSAAIEQEKSAEQKEAAEVGEEKAAKEQAAEQLKIAEDAKKKLQEAVEARAAAEANSEAEAKEVTEATEKAELAGQDTEAAKEKAAQLEALLKKANEDEASANDQVQTTVQEMQALQDKLSAALASAAKEHEDADARREEASKAEADANEKVADAQAKAAASQQHADELEVALKRAQLLAATAASRAEVYAGDAASNATALEDAMREADKWRKEMEARAQAAEEGKAKAEADKEAAAKALADAQAAAAKSAEEHAQGDFEMKALKDKVEAFQEELDKLSQAKAAAEKAQHDALMQANLAKQQLHTIIGGGPRVTTQGCQCAKSFDYQGSSYHGCIPAGDNMMAQGKDWCVTDGICGSSLGDGQFFDTCPIPTKRGCSCRTAWMTMGHPVDGCSEERSKGKPWCKVREVGCGEQNGDGAWWDYCAK